MSHLFKRISALAFLVSYAMAFSSRAQTSVSEERIAITSITPSVNTGQDYSPWLDDDLSNLVKDNWLPSNFQYIDVTLKLAKSTVLSRVSLYDYQGVFQLQPATIYAQNGTTKTLIGTFDGSHYKEYVDMTVPGSVTADAIVIHKYCNNIPVKLKVFGQSNGTPTAPPSTPTSPTTPSTPTTPALVPSVLVFPGLPAKTVGAAPFTLTAVSTNLLTPITYASSNPSVATVTAMPWGQWQATVVGPGTTTITASQVAGGSFLAAASVSQTLLVQPAAPTNTPVAGKIPLDAKRWYQLSNAANTITPLFDGSTATGATTNWGKVIGSYDAYYPLLPGEAISLDNIRFYDGEGSNPNDPMTLSVITDTWQRIPVATFTGGQYNRWVGPDPNQPDVFRLSTPVSNIRYLVLTATIAYPTEIELYGSYTAGSAVPAADPQALAIAKKIKLRQEMGVNAFEWDVEDPNSPGQVDEARLKGVKNFTGIRHYLDWQKLESTEGGYTFNPAHSGGWNYDIMYQRLKAEGVEVLACLKTLPDWMLSTYPGDQRDNENVPVRYGKDFSDPNSYLEQAKLAFQYAARYGYNPGVSANLLHVDPSTRWAGDGVNQVKVGLSLIKYIECENERDKWWKGRKAYQTGREYAANLSAFYDGNKNTMGPGVGVKNADPTMQVVMAGLAAPTPDYVRGMIDWCKQYRGYKADGTVNLCWDVINYHLYSNDASTSQGGSSTRGAAPEVSSAGQTARDFVQMAHQYANDMPVWITETGYDTNQGSPLKAIAIGNKTVLQTQADWILRSALLYARWGVERTFHYQLADENPNSSVQFSSMGLINPDHTPKLAAAYLQQANALLGNYTYTGTLNNDPLVDRYEADGKTIYALVVPDEKGRTATYTLSLGSATTATLYQPGQGAMSATPLNIQNGQVTINVTETPQFVVANGGTASTAPSSSCPGTGSIGWEQWTNVNGKSLAAIPFQNTADNTATLTQFESGHSIGDNFGARIRGYVCPPQDGSYTFQISGDDACQLWLSTDENPDNKVLIASVSGWTNPGEWNKYATQQSAAVALQTGRRYYIEAIHKENDGGDFVAVGWTLPGGQAEAPIPGSRLIPFNASAAAQQMATTSAAKAKLASESAASRGAAAQATTKAELSVYPNPFTDQTSIEFSLPTAGTASLVIYDEQNRVVQRLFSGAVEAGTRSRFAVPGANLAAGFYLVKLTTSNQVVTQKLIRMQ